MDIAKLKRNPTAVRTDLKKGSDNSIYTQGGCTIYIPQTYQDRKLVTIGVESYILGYYAIVLPDESYGVSMVPALIRTEPDTIDTEEYDGTTYLVLGYKPKSLVVANTNIVQNGKLLFDVYNEFFAKGNIPWYINYEDLGKLFTRSKKYAGSKLGDNHVTTELLAAIIARDPKDLTIQYRHVATTAAASVNNPPAIVKLNSVTYGATNTTSRLVGAYYDDGLTSALLNPSTEVEPIENLLLR